MKTILYEKITVRLPKALVREAMETSKRGLTDTLIVGLEMVCGLRALEKAKKLKGGIKIKTDLNKSRGRPAH